MTTGGLAGFPGNDRRALGYDGWKHPSWRAEGKNPGSNLPCMIGGMLCDGPNSSQTEYYTCSRREIATFGVVWSRRKRGADVGRLFSRDGRGDDDVVVRRVAAPYSPTRGCLTRWARRYVFKESRAFARTKGR